MINDLPPVLVLGAIMLAVVIDVGMIVGWLARRWRAWR